MTDRPSESVLVTDGWEDSRLSKVWVIIKALVLCSVLKVPETQTLLSWLDTEMAHAKAGRLEPFWEARQRQFSSLSTAELYELL